MKKAEDRLAGHGSPWGPQTWRSLTLLQRFLQEPHWGLTESQKELQKCPRGAGLRRGQQPCGRERGPPLLPPSTEQKLNCWAKCNKYSHPQGTGERALQLEEEGVKNPYSWGGTGHPTTQSHGRTEIKSEHQRPPRSPLPCSAKPTSLNKK